jgi:hypothetical protein
MLPRLHYVLPQMKRSSEHHELPRNDLLLRKWEPIFRATEEGRLPNRLAENLEVCQELHRYGYHWRDRPTIAEARAWLAKRRSEKKHK